MFCPTCGSPISDDAKFCPVCGSAVGAASAAAAPQPQPAPAQAIQPAPQPQQQYTGQYAQQSASAPMGYGPIKADRSLIGWLLLSLVTCGIYSFYFLYCLARDVNTLCQDDGDYTPGLAEFILLSFVTCGFYAYYWYYKIGNRLQANAPRYGLVFQENGTTVLLWQIFGALLCGLGPIFAMNIVINNTNAMARLTTLALALVPNNKGGVNSSQGHRGTAELLRRALFCTGALFVAWLALYLLDIGCIFRLMTGIPCPGCGMTRAWLAALRLDYAAAFAYHPLFWVVPIAFVLAFVREEVASSKLKRGIDIAVTVLCVLVVVVWIVRLINPADAGLLFGGYAPAGVPDDIIHLEPPRWLTILRSYLA